MVLVHISTCRFLLPEEVREGCRKEVKFRLSLEGLLGFQQARQGVTEGASDRRDCKCEACGWNTEGPLGVKGFFEI